MLSEEGLNASDGLMLDDIAGSRLSATRRAPSDSVRTVVSMEE